MDMFYEQVKLYKSLKKGKRLSTKKLDKIFDNLDKKYKDK